MRTHYADKIFVGFLASLFLLSPLIASAAIARDIHGSSGGATDTGKTVSLTLAAGTVLAVCTGNYEAADTATSVTWNGTTLTEITNGHQAGGAWFHLFFLGNPTSGTHNLISSFGASAYNDMFAASYTGANTANPTSFDYQGSASATSISATLSTTASAWFFSCGNGGPGLAGSTNATQLDTDGGGGNQSSFDSNGIAGSTAMTLTRSGSGLIQIVALAIQAAAAASTATPIAGLVQAYWIQ